MRMSKILLFLFCLIECVVGGQELILSSHLNVSPTSKILARSGQGGMWGTRQLTPPPRDALFVELVESHWHKSDAAHIDVWYDSSGNGNDFVQPTGTSQPVVTDSGAISFLNEFRYMMCVNDPVPCASWTFVMTCPEDFDTSINYGSTLFTNNISAKYFWLISNGGVLTGNIQSLQGWTDYNTSGAFITMGIDDLNTPTQSGPKVFAFRSTPGVGNTVTLDVFFNRWNAEDGVVGTHTLDATTSFKKRSTVVGSYNPANQLVDHMYVGYYMGSAANNIWIYKRPLTDDEIRFTRWERPSIREGLVREYHPNNWTLADATRIAIWEDSSGHSNDAYQSISVNQPIASSSGFVDFYPGNTMMMPAFVATDTTWVVQVKQRSNTDGRYAHVLKGDYSNVMYNGVTDTFNFAIAGQDRTINNYTPHYLPADPPEFFAGIAFNRSDSTFHYAVRLEGASATSCITGVYNIAGNVDYTQICATSTAYSEFGWPGEVKRVWQYNTHRDSAELSELIDTLSAMYPN